MKKKCEYGCNLWIDTDSYHPSIVTEITQVNCTSLEIKGEYEILTNGRTGGIYEKNIWSIESERRIQKNEWNLETSIKEILSVLLANESEFMKVFSMFPNKCLLCYAYIYDYNISFRIPHETIFKINKFELPIDFDLYSFE